MEQNVEDYKLIFEKEGVYLHTNAKKSNQDTTIPGFIRIVERAGVPALEWSPLEDGGRSAPAVLYTKKDRDGGEEDMNFDPGYEPDWAVISTVKRDREQVPVRDSGLWSFSLALSELYSLRRARISLGKNFLVLTSRGGHPLPALHFHRGGTRELFSALQRYIMLDQSPVDGRLFLAYPHDSGALSQSFEKLQLLDDGGVDLVSRFIHDPYATTFGGFSKVTNFFKAALKPPGSPGHFRTAQDPSLPHQCDEEPGFELINCGVALGPRPDVTRGEPLDQWDEFLDPEGRVKNPEKIKELVFRGGVTPFLRKEVWKFLLGFYPWDSTAKEREDILRLKTDEYFRMKVQWKSVGEEQEMRNSLLRGYRSLIERDVSRTDRHNTFFSGNDNPGLTLLHDVLMTYCMYNFDLGYVQGMSDLLSPLLFVTQNEVESFWCLTGFMALLHQNFEESQEAMKKQLLQLSILLKALDPELCDFLDSQDSGSLCFCFRWLLIWFKREFSFEDILTMWEVLWSGLPCDNFHLLIACSILVSQRGELIGSDHDFNTILKHINELTMKLDLQTVLRGAESIFLQLTQCKELSLKVQEVLGLYIPSSSEEDSPDSSQASETRRLLASSPAGASSSSSSSSPAARVPTYP
ncbi:TBC1 domain family member 17 [Pseudoliparis swirei]|uniref:TBC1 domain family member 17 n=1 Tax=Pseudoliparis swirei TaxID=2059687 RepID=UPI0024BD935E|nr:TBC1 domain family member 17 [Pseudoliparis swirei]XP_056263661.1 TBC1 domain family member 17 [Pseudoliparis swirei]XP_056263662.1 TBC1 domain family member 17 [Pseudoliparis swirei]XP_056263663.1 TBC1 domain family member 17 [Pseudoliparis swirei]XP_056263664.1 TBC1 domain family member 17 [Pseudoliparis swirei]